MTARELHDSALNALERLVVRMDADFSRENRSEMERIVSRLEDSFTDIEDIVATVRGAVEEE